MAAGDVVRFSIGGLRGHGVRTGLSLLGVAIGVASVILLTSLGEGARLFVTGEFDSLGSDLLVVIPGKTETAGTAPLVSTAPNDLTVDDAEAIRRRVPGVRRAVPIALGSTAVSYRGRSRNMAVVGNTHDILPIWGLTLSSGRFLPEGAGDAPICVIGVTAQRELFGDQNPLGEMLRIGDARFRVIGVTAPRGTLMTWNLDDVIHIPVESALRVFNRTSLFRILVSAGGQADLEATRARVIAVLTERHDGEEDVTLLTQDALRSTFGQILTMLTAVLAGIAAISLTVAGIGIMNVMLVSVSERTREIGLLKAVGVTRSQILWVFLLEAGAISTGGGILGLLAGLGLGRVVSHFTGDFPIQPPIWAVAAALLVSVTIGVVFGSLPARRATRLDPVEALMRQRA